MIGMSSAIPQKQVILKFLTLKVISEFKHKCACPDFYIDRDALILVGSFTPEQVTTAIQKFGATSL
jgi:hypothetical protein